MELLTFYPIFKEKIWGGSKIRQILGKDFSPLDNCGEAWEICDDAKNISVVANGKFKGLSLKELIIKYREALVGRRNYRVFGSEFPLLIKFIDAKEDLSIQVHPDDGLALRRHDCFGKTEFWYILDHDPNARLLYGFKDKINQSIYLEHLRKDTLVELLNAPQVREGDTFFMPAGRVHAIGAGVLLAEIQQNCDITYRIYDYNRPDKNGKLRPLHTIPALEAIKFEDNQPYINSSGDSRTKKLCSNEYFKVDYHFIEESKVFDYSNFDAFVIYICVAGRGYINYRQQRLDLKIGQVLLVPAALEEVKIEADATVKILECYVPQGIDFELNS